MGGALLKLRAALRSTHDLDVHAPALSLTQRQLLALTGDVGIGTTDTGDRHLGATVRTQFGQPGEGDLKR